MLDKRYDRDPTYSLHNDQMPHHVLDHDDQIIIRRVPRSVNPNVELNPVVLAGGGVGQGGRDHCHCVRSAGNYNVKILHPTDRDDWCDISKVLQPTDQTKIEEYYCAHDSHSGGGNTFHEAIAQVLLSTSPPSWFTLGRLKQSSSYHQDYHHYDHSANLGIPNIMWPDIENQSP